MKKRLEDVLSWYQAMTSGNLRSYGLDHAMTNHLYKSSASEAEELNRLKSLQEKGRLFGVSGDVVTCQFSNKKVMASCLKNAIASNLETIKTWYSKCNKDGKNLQLYYTSKNPIADGLTSTGERVKLYKVRVSLNFSWEKGFLVKTCYPYL